MTSKAVSLRQKLANTVVASIETHAAEVHGVLTELFEPVLLEGETVPDVEKFLHLLARKLASERRQLTEAEEELQISRWRQRKARVRRRRARDELYRRIVEVRRAAIRAYGRSAAETYLDVAGPTPRAPRRLRSFAEHLLARLEDPYNTPPPPRHPGVDPWRWLLTTSPALQSLAKAIIQLRGEAVRGRWFLALKRRKLRQFDETYRSTREFLGAVYDLAGMKHLRGELLHPGGRRRRSSRKTEVGRLAEIIRHPSADFSGET